MTLPEVFRRSAEHGISTWALVQWLMYLGVKLPEGICNGKSPFSSVMPL